jgi:2-(1,2-epoxy-1,2-dihydrophenyl)acetyl-CoA isomerase
MSTSDVLQCEQDGSVRILRLNDYKTRNSLSDGMRAALAQAWRDALEDDGVRVVFLTGSRGFFCSGGNLETLSKLGSPWDVHQRFSNLGSWLLPLIRYPKPVVVGLNGPAIGGGMGLALTGDVIVASESATLVSPFFKVGVVPDVATMYMLPRLLGMARAKNFIFGNGVMDAATGRDLGLLDEVVPDALLEEAGLKKAEALARGPVRAMGLAKQIMGRSFESDLEGMFMYESLGQSLAMSNDEFREGVNAFLERRKPGFE